jgi:hypothetical protein
MAELTSLGFEGEIEELQWATFAPGLSEISSLMTPDSFEASSVTSTRAAKFRHGGVQQDGIQSINPDDEALLSFEAPRDGRWSLVVVSRDWTTRTSTLEALPGPTTGPTMPSPRSAPLSPPASFTSNPGVIAHVALYWVWVSGSSTNLLFVDVRPLPATALAGTVAQRELVFPRSTEALEYSLQRRGARWFNTETMTQGVYGSYGGWRTSTPSVRDSFTDTVDNPTAVQSGNRRELFRLTDALRVDERGLLHLDITALISNPNENNFAGSIYVELDGARVASRRFVNLGRTDIVEFALARPVQIERGIHTLAVYASAESTSPNFTVSNVSYAIATTY